MSSARKRAESSPHYKSYLSPFLGLPLSKCTRRKQLSDSPGMVLVPQLVQNNNIIATSLSPMNVNSENPGTNLGCASGMWEREKRLRVSLCSTLLLLAAAGAAPWTISRNKRTIQIRRAALLCQIEMETGRVQREILAEESSLPVLWSFATASIHEMVGNGATLNAKSVIWCSEQTLQLGNFPPSVRLCFSVGSSMCSCRESLVGGHLI